MKIFVLLLKDNTSNSTASATNSDLFFTAMDEAH